MKRRSFLLGGGAAAGAAATGAGFWRWQEIAPRLLVPGRDLGHRLRDLKPGDWPAPSADYTTDVAIVGSGIAGLTAAWRLAREGHTRFALVTGPEAHGNAASGTTTIDGERLRYPTGAHYLPLPSMESVHVRTMLSDFGVLLDGAATTTPTYDERVLVHAPDERLFRDGALAGGPRSRRRRHRRRHRRPASVDGAAAEACAGIRGVGDRSLLPRRRHAARGARRGRPQGVRDPDRLRVDRSALDGARRPDVRCMARPRRPR